MSADSALLLDPGYTTDDCETALQLVQEKYTLVAARMEASASTAHPIPLRIRLRSYLVGVLSRLPRLPGQCVPRDLYRLHSPV